MKEEPQSDGDEWKHQQEGEHVIVMEVSSQLHDVVNDHSTSDDQRLGAIEGGCDKNKRDIVKDHCTGDDRRIGAREGRYEKKK